MIIQPNFLEHWKTRQLVELTGDESAPLAVIRLWAHCQNSKRGTFPEMTPAQLASICRWDKRKPACHVALVKGGFVDKLKPKGFAAHQWSEHNRQLLQKWEAGKNGGRPQKSENANEFPQDEKPIDNRPIIVRLVDKIRPDELDQTRPVQTSSDAPQLHALGASLPRSDTPNSESGVGRNGLDGMLDKLTKRVVPIPTPTLEQVHNCLKMHFDGAERYAEAFVKSMNKQHWRDKEGGQITCWQSVAKAYASKAALNQSKR